jgi:PB1 domain
MGVTFGKSSHEGVGVKVTFGREIRRATFVGTSFTELKALVGDLFGLDYENIDIRLKYKDEDGDFISLVFSFFSPIILFPYHSFPLSFFSPIILVPFPLFFPILFFPYPLFSLSSFFPILIFPYPHFSLSSLFIIAVGKSSFSLPLPHFYSFSSFISLLRFCFLSHFPSFLISPFHTLAYFLCSLWTKRYKKQSNFLWQRMVLSFCSWS